MAKVLQSLGPLELLHASDAQEALNLLETQSPDVLVLDDELADESEVIIEHLQANHPAIFIQTDGKRTPKKSIHGREVKAVPRSETLEGLHVTLSLAAKAGKERNLSIRAELH